MKTGTNAVDTNPTVSIITLNVNGLNPPTKKTEIVRVDQKTRPNNTLSTRNPL